MTKLQIKEFVLMLCKYGLPPLLFLAVLAPSHIGMSQIAERFCGGTMRMGHSQTLKEGYIAVVRIYDEDSDCWQPIYMDTEKVMSRNFGDVIGALNALLQYRVCFNQETSLDDVNSPASDPVKFFVESKAVIPFSLRVEAESGVGIDVPQGECVRILPNMQGRLEMHPDMFGGEVISKKTFEQLKTDGFIAPSSEVPDTFEADFFEHTSVTVKPKYIYLYIYIGLVLSWMGVLKIIRESMKKKEDKQAV
ncbi:MAG: hypothetical protein PHI23_03650 [Candidatus Peribacteraceae bacterium]|nr:hypothetical protein [Candidatus Peribacteraceae bacterium]